MNEAAILEALKKVRYPGYSRDVVAFGLVKQTSFQGGVANVRIELTTPNPEVARQIKADAEHALSSVPGISSAVVEVSLPQGSAGPPGAQTPWAQQRRVEGIHRIVAVASGKGGVGKSTVSVNLACALASLGVRTGLLDCDIYGPSIPLMMGVTGKPQVSAEEKMVPPVNHGVKLMSMGFLIEGDMPVIWRGPMIQKTVQQFFGAVGWGELDILLVDLPPGTGDAQLSLCQTVPLDGGVIVTTPQEASLGVVRKGIGMFRKVNVPLLGLIENMSFFEAPGGGRHEIFGHGGGRAEAARQGVPFLGEIPLFIAIREGGDRGIPITVSDPKSPAAQTFLQMARTLSGTLS